MQDAEPLNRTRDAAMEDRAGVPAAATVMGMTLEVSERRVHAAADSYAVYGEAVVGHELEVVISPWDSFGESSYMVSQGTCNARPAAMTRTWCARSLHGTRDSPADAHALVCSVP